MIVVGGISLALVATVAVRDATWLVVLVTLAAFGCASFAVAAGRRWHTLLLGALAVPLGAFRMFPWLRRGLAAAHGRRASLWPILRAVLLGLGLLLVFGGLFAGADPAFADLAGRLVPGLSLLPVRVGVFVLTVTAALAAAYVAVNRPQWDSLPVVTPRPAARREWALPLIMLDALFLAFIAVQVTVLFGGRTHILRTQGLTYAEYARQGFWQLLLVTLLTFGVLTVAVWKAPRTTGADRLLARALLGLLILFALVVVASALYRMNLYEQAFGFTRLRVFVTAVELWFGVVLVLVALAGIRLRASWLPQAVAGSGAVALIALAALNPDALIAERNIARWHDGQQLDVRYLANLSADAAPALSRLPEPQRSCALFHISRELTNEPWYAFNLGRYRARDMLDGQRISFSPECLTLESERR